MSRRTFALFALVSAACAPDEPANAADGPVLLSSRDVAVVDEQLITTGPLLTGSLEPRRSAQLRAEVGGAVTRVLVEVGERVEQGQPLAQIEDLTLRDDAASARAAVRAAELELDVAEAELERSERLVAIGALPARDLETARQAVAAARARREQAEAGRVSSKEQLAAARLEAPMNGVVAERAVNEGDVVAPGALLFSIMDPSSMRLEAAINAEALALFAPGDEVLFEVRGYPEQTFTGTIERIAPAVDETTRQIPVFVELPNPGARLVAGLYAEGRVGSEEHRALVVPLAAIDETAATPTVSRIRGGEVEKVAVRLGLIDEREEQAEVQSGLEAGDTVLTGAARQLAAGTPVRIQSAASE